MENQRDFNTPLVTVPERMFGYVVFTGAAALGGLLCQAKVFVFGVPLVVGGLGADYIEWQLNAQIDANIAGARARSRVTCILTCGLDWQDMAAAKAYLATPPPKLIK